MGDRPIQLGATKGPHGASEHQSGPRPAPRPDAAPWPWPWSEAEPQNPRSAAQGPGCEQHPATGLRPGAADPEPEASVYDPGLHLGLYLGWQPSSRPGSATVRDGGRQKEHGQTPSQHGVGRDDPDTHAAGNRRHPGKAGGGERTRSPVPRNLTGVSSIPPAPAAPSEVSPISDTVHARVPVLTQTPKQIPRPAAGVALHLAPSPHASHADCGWTVVLAVADTGEAAPLGQRIEAHGHTVRKVETGRMAIQQGVAADLVILDPDLPDLDGLEVCRVIRRVSAVPIIAVASRCTETDVVLAFQAGVDDFVAKPYGFHELMARMTAVMRRVGPHEEIIAYGPLLIDARRRVVQVHDRRIRMTRKEFDLLFVLASESGRVVPRKRLMQHVWGDTWSSRTIDTHVNSLRRKLGSPDWIVTVRGVGFQLGHE